MCIRLIVHGKRLPLAVRENMTNFLTPAVGTSLTCQWQENGLTAVCALCDSFGEFHIPHARRKVREFDWLVTANSIDEICFNAPATLLFPRYRNLGQFAIVCVTTRWCWYVAVSWRRRRRCTEKTWISDATR